MYTVTVKTKDGAQMVFKTDKRPIARAVKLACVEMEYECTVVVEQRREVKFKGIEARPAATPELAVTNPTDKESEKSDAATPTPPASGVRSDKKGKG